MITLTITFYISQLHIYVYGIKETWDCVATEVTDNILNDRPRVGIFAEAYFFHLGWLLSMLLAMALKPSMYTFSTPSREFFALRGYPIAILQNNETFWENSSSILGINEHRTCTQINNYCIPQHVKIYTHSQWSLNAVNTTRFSSIHKNKHCQVPPPPPRTLSLVLYFLRLTYQICPL